MKKIIDLRSDTVTKPTEEMKKAMMKAPLGDDVFQEDPTVNKLQKKLASLFRKEDALFVPSGTMSNQLALGVHCSPGDELICDPTYHINKYECGAPARLWGITTKLISGDQGVLNVKEHLAHSINPDNIHVPKTKLICLENTLNVCGGKIYPYEKMVEISAWGKQNNLRLHLDGARLFNAAIKEGKSLDTYGKYFDTISVCLSKGLGTPVGSVLIGNTEQINKARRLRKLLGGGMRQAGVLAAAGLYALENHVERLTEDHENAFKLGQIISEFEELSLKYEVETNIVFIDTKQLNSQIISKELEKEGILSLPMDQSTIRLVTHLGVNSDDIRDFSEGFYKVIKKIRKN